MKSQTSVSDDPRSTAAAPYRAEVVRLAVAPRGVPSELRAAWLTPVGVRWWGLGELVRFEAGAEAHATENRSAAAEVADQARAALAEIAAQAPAAAPLLRAFGGLAFDTARPGRWPAAAFWVPEAVVRARGEEIYLVVAGRRQPGEGDAAFAARHAARVAAYQALLEAPRETPLPAPGHVRPNPGAQARWEAMVTAALDAIAAGHLVKAVPARGLALEFAEAPSPAAWFDALAEAAPGTDRVFLQPDPALAFLAATPEVLFAQAGGRLDVDGLAGTAKRGADEAEDAELAAALMASPKERHEHEVVVGFIREALAPFVSGLDAPATPGLRKLATLQHLHTAITADIDPGAPLATWLGALHPTPAVCGQPREAARAFLRAHEERARGWYAGALGLVGLDEARFVVGLRAALFEDGQAWLPAGAGVVDGSDPAAEWAEVERKQAPMRRLCEEAR